MSKASRRIVLLLAIGVFTLIPAVLWASHQFQDVPDSNTFHDDIAWLADAEVTLGCNPPDNTEFCPGDDVTRGQMAAFLNRLANNQVVDAGWLDGMTADEIIDAAATGTTGPIHAETADHADTADHAEDADTVGGMEPADLLPKWARVDAEGNIVEQSGGISVVAIEGPSDNAYFLDFGTDVADHLLLANPWIKDAGSGSLAVEAIIGVGPCGIAETICGAGRELDSLIRVQTFNHAGTATARPYYVAAFPPPG